MITNQNSKFQLTCASKYINQKTEFKQQDQLLDLNVNET